MWNLLLIGIGGFIGSVLRYLFSGSVQSLSRSFEFPYGTLAVNVLGCLVIGALAELAEAHGLFRDEARSFLFVGVLGGFTTFSTFGNETMNLLRDGEGSLAFANVGAHFLFGLCAVWFGRVMIRMVWR